MKKLFKKIFKGKKIRLLNVNGIEFDISRIPENGQITNATLSLYDFENSVDIKRTELFYDSSDKIQNNFSPKLIIEYEYPDKEKQ